MLQGIRTIVFSVAAGTAAGVLFGVLVGTMLPNTLMWIGIGAFVGANFGLALAYGFLPESEADLESEEGGSG